MVDHVIEHLEEWSAAATSQFSHVWGDGSSHTTGKTIPYESVFIDNKPLTTEEQARGLEVAKEHGLLDR